MIPLAKIHEAEKYYTQTQRSSFSTQGIVFARTEEKKNDLLHTKKKQSKNYVCIHKPQHLEKEILIKSAVLMRKSNSPARC